MRRFSMDETAEIFKNNYYKSGKQMGKISQVERGKIVLLFVSKQIAKLNFLLEVQNNKCQSHLILKL